MVDGLTRLKYIETALKIAKDNRWLIGLIVAGLGSNGLHFWHSADQHQVLENTNEALKIYANVAATTIKPVRHKKTVTYKAYNDTDIIKRLTRLERFH